MSVFILFVAKTNCNVYKSDYFINVSTVKTQMVKYEKVETNQLTIKRNHSINNVITIGIVILSQIEC